MYRLKSAQSVVMYYSRRRQYAGLKLSGILLRLLHALCHFTISLRPNQPEGKVLPLAASTYCPPISIFTGCCFKKAYRVVSVVLVVIYIDPHFRFANTIALTRAFSALRAVHRPRTSHPHAH